MNEMLEAMSLAKDTYIDTDKANKRLAALLAMMRNMHSLKNAVVDRMLRAYDSTQARTLIARIADEMPKLRYFPSSRFKDRLTGASLWEGLPEKKG